MPPVLPIFLYLQAYNSRMKKLFFWCTILFAIGISCNAPKSGSAGAGRAKWVALFNGKDLQGWTPKFAGFKPGENLLNTFRVEQGILSTRYDQYDRFNDHFGALYFNKPFTNYRLRFEYRFVGDTVAGAPSWGYKDGGIQYHGQDPASMQVDQPFPVCLEYNLHGGNGQGERPTGEICAPGIYFDIDGKRNTLFCTPPSVKKTFHGSEWVQGEIEVNNGRISHFVNGEKVLEFSNPRYDPGNENARKLIRDGNDLVSGGFISIQSNSHPMDFRNIEILEY